MPDGGRILFSSAITARRKNRQRIGDPLIKLIFCTGTPINLMVYLSVPLDKQHPVCDDLRL